MCNDMPLWFYLHFLMTGDAEHIFTYFGDIYIAFLNLSLNILLFKILFDLPITDL